jgi:hypothetical protein
MALCQIETGSRGKDLASRHPIQKRVTDKNDEASYRISLGNSEKVMRIWE